MEKGNGCLGHEDQNEGEDLPVRPILAAATKTGKKDLGHRVEFDETNSDNALSRP